ncbi:AI-2E family transporter [Candidatus Saccharibacteria bacterium]|jgi:predicted PurR-regulated permease PerM|nr:AI-2E family transporter [Candidatus Saccharibacteria bacterium]
MKKLSNKTTVTVNVTNQTMIRAVAIVVGFVLLVAAIYVAKLPLTLIIIAFFLALALSPAVNWLTAHLPGENKRRGVATGIAYLTILSLITFLGYLLIPPLANQTENFVRELPDFINQLETGDDFVSGFIQKYELTDQITELEDELSSRVTNVGGPLFEYVGQIFSNIAALLIIVVLAFFMLVEGPEWFERYSQLLSTRRRAHHKELADKMYKVITGFVNGQLLVATIAAASTFVVLTIVDVDFALPLAVLVGIFGLVPFIGATLASIIVVIAALFQSSTAAIIVLVYYIIYQQIENNFIQPIVQSRTLEMSPMLVFIASVIGVYVGGILGAILAIPLAGCIRVLVNDYIDRKHLIHETK